MILKAVVTNEFSGRPDGESLPRTIAIGEQVHGELARTAIDNGWADEVKAAGPVAKPAAKPKSGRAPARKATAKKKR